MMHAAPRNYKTIPAPRDVKFTVNAWHQRAQLAQNAPSAPKLLCLRPGQREDGSRRERPYRALRRAHEQASTTTHPTPTPAPRRPRRLSRRTGWALQRLVRLKNRGLATCSSTCLAWTSAGDLRKRLAAIEREHGALRWALST